MRSLTELELALDDTAAVLLANSLGDNQLSLFPELSSRIDSAAISTLIIDQDSVAPINLPNLLAATLEPKRNTMSVRSTAFMFGDVLRVVAIAGMTAPSGNIAKMSVGIEKVGDRWRAVLHGGLEDQFVGLRPEGADAWLFWLGQEPVRLARVVQVLRAAARAIQQQVIASVNQIIREHPEFGDAYVTMRHEIMRSRRRIEPVRTTAVQRNAA